MILPYPSYSTQNIPQFVLLNSPTAKNGIHGNFTNLIKTDDLVPKANLRSRFQKVKNKTVGSGEFEAPGASLIPLILYFSTLHLTKQRNKIPNTHIQSIEIETQKENRLVFFSFLEI